MQDFWGDPLTAAGSQSSDGKAAYVQIYLVGNQGETKANDSVKAVRKLVEDTPPPPGVKAYVTGAAALTADQSAAGDKGVILVTMLTFVVIIVMLLWVYRSIVTMFVTLLMVMLELFAARQVVAFLADNDIIGLSTFAVNLLVLMVIAASTDYAIFVLGRYQEARSLGEDREQAFFTMFHGTAHVVLGSGLTIAGAMYCLSFTRLPYFQSLGVPCAVGTLVAVLAALTLGPADLDGGQSDRLPVRPQAEDADAGLAAGGYRHCPVARPDPGRVDRASRSSACSHCPGTGPIMTIASTCRRARRRSSDMRPRSGISPTPG